MPTHAFELRHFIIAQEPIYPQVRSELAAGRKRSHWMWFIFPQLEGLGHSDMSRRYAISGREHALAYLQHPILGRRLHECTDLVLAALTSDATEIFGYPDNLKFHSCMTLFSQVSNAAAPFSAALTRYFQARPDSATLRLLNYPQSL